MPDRDTTFALILVLAASLALLAVTFVAWLQRNSAARNNGPLQSNVTPAAAVASAGGGGPWVEPAFPAQTGAAPGAGAEDLTEEEESVERDGLVDPLTGLKTSLAWEQALRHEEARQLRYGRNTTVVVAELSGLESLAERLGQEAADLLIPPVAKTLLRGTRAADVVARVGHSRFHLLLTETDEIAAINYVDRIRDATDLWLSAGAVAVRLALGWASPKAGGSLADAVRVAEERMNADRRPDSGPRGVRRAASPAKEVSD